ncbi:hypothetical protein PoB_003821000 [Plakobranchus ocellatus]|uniref:Uncharacterized protein n=1 Tax=Plakobranchus ocellatus TaxID=259542 RepID=A0AAV4AWS8_9GAST|nr:hypothetical protein PoB_003821000 [Plakobranchus ocellatus]
MLCKKRWFVATSSSNNSSRNSSSNGSRTRSCRSNSSNSQRSSNRNSSNSHSRSKISKQEEDSVRDTVEDDPVCAQVIIEERDGHGQDDQVGDQQHQHEEIPVEPGVKSKTVYKPICGYFTSLYNKTRREFEASQDPRCVPTISEPLDRPSHKLLDISLGLEERKLSQCPLSGHRFLFIGLLSLFDGRTSGHEAARKAKRNLVKIELLDDRDCIARELDERNDIDR